MFIPVATLRAYLSILGFNDEILVYVKDDYKMFTDESKHVVRTKLGYFKISYLLENLQDNILDSTKYDMNVQHRGQILVLTIDLTEEK